MKLLCIKRGTWTCPITGQPHVGPKYGDFVTVKKETSNAYTFIECPEVKRGYIKKPFVPLSDKDETEYSEKIMEQIFVTV